VFVFVCVVVKCQHLVYFPLLSLSLLLAAHCCYDVVVVSVLMAAI